MNGAGTALDEARAALRARQGAGARYDADGAPHTELAWARAGTAFFARALAELSDADLSASSLLPGWDRRALIAHVGYNARALTRLCTWGRTGTECPMYASPRQRAAEIARGATLPARALRSLFAHSEVHLNVEWRDLPGPAWDASVVTAQGRTVPLRETAWMRTREVWVHAVDLGGGAGFRDIPPGLLDRLAADVLAAWERRGERPALTLAATDRDAPLAVAPGGGPSVTGTAADLTRWLTGRGARRLTCDHGELPRLPRWL
ncbi:maleylpyruvate isomerase family mycothiol-dependent enzyme [Streptomyces johnsoniae]|uniref:Maleylpyruvate isomerase family mycothiol-dependent enzyme n=1 Tax=Streptomyces johnsoniae TaxID=3075532 RepID=A0ABU2S992_9ACTN|nr:maleylpyruvate isomerase family mycothiol-dependent enzyme [Streptomyces sp. DSM 41886]MDT0444374.1 maleylpyruvate isomerase family mycothiol-dependent enzyme [Streptomyces sp. DSM 41886]